MNSLGKSHMAELQALTPILLLTSQSSGGFPGILSRGLQGEARKIFLSWFEMQTLSFLKMSDPYAME